jgi:EGF-like domain
MTGSECTNNEDCLNGGICRREENGSFLCKCATGYWGDRCDPICSLPCKHGGHCVRINGSGGVKCQCPDGFEGGLCDEYVSINQNNVSIHDSLFPSKGNIIIVCATSAVWMIILVVSLIVCRRRNPHRQSDMEELRTEYAVDKDGSYSDNDVEDTALGSHTIIIT